MPPTFTERELDVMAILWERGPSTVAEVRGLGLLDAIQITPNKATKAKWAKDTK